jgi:hypothetical protein
MANRCTLHRSQLQAFVEWLQLQNFAVEITEGQIEYQVLRARRDDLKRPIIVYSRSKGDHYTLDDRDIPFVRGFWDQPETPENLLEEHGLMPWGL